MVASPFDYPLPSGGSVGAAILEPVLAENIVPIVVDVGARNGMMLLPASLAKHCVNVGFEPNPEEHRKLVEGRTDAAAHGYAPPRFRETRYVQCAAWDREERRPLYMTIGPGATTMMGRARAAVTEHMFLGEGGTGSYESLHTSVGRTEEVPCRPLDDVLPNETIDFLKVDCEGAELRVLRGSAGLLARHDVLLIKTEVVLVPYYEEHPLLGHQHVFLSEHGYRLIDLDFEHAGYARYPTRIESAVDRRLKYAGDAYFMPDPDLVATTPIRRQRAAAMAAALGFHSLAVGLLREAGLTPAQRIDEIESVLSHVPARTRLRRSWNQIPYAVYAGLRRLRFPL
jgi:FkbM family methyltransferase